jgi:hypothetical protein
MIGLPCKHIKMRKACIQKGEKIWCHHPWLASHFSETPSITSSSRFSLPGPLKMAYDVTHLHIWIYKRDRDDILSQHFSIIAFHQDFLFTGFKETHTSISGRAFQGY